jgi:hypothetical protein
MDHRNISEWKRNKYLKTAKKKSIEGLINKNYCIISEYTFIWLVLMQKSTLGQLNMTGITDNFSWFGSYTKSENILEWFIF